MLLSPTPPLLLATAAGWPVQGIWAAGMDGSDINAVARSHSGHLLASSDDLGKVNLFR